MNKKNENSKSKAKSVKKPTGPKNLPAKKAADAKEPVKIKTAEAAVPDGPKSPTVILVQPKMTDEQLRVYNSAVKIQCAWKKFKAVKELNQLRTEKKELDEKLAKLEQEAYIQMIKLEQEREEKKRLKRLHEKEMKRKNDLRKKKFMDAAYDGSLQEMKFIVSDFERELDSMEEKFDPGKRKQAILNLIDCKDSNNNSALSEAAAGGSAEVCKFLLSNNADPNSRGAFNRTPLWRAAFAGHLHCVQILLENGADPRMYSQDGQRVVDAATKDNVIDVLKHWNIQLTERMLQQIEKSRKEIKQEQINGLEEQKKIAKKNYEQSRAQFEYIKNELLKCTTELQRLHDEYLLNPDMYAPLIDKKESERVDLCAKSDHLKEQSVKSRIFYKDLLSEIRKEKKKIKNDTEDSDSEPGSDDDEPELDDDKEKFRIALLGSIRYGKPFVIDLMQYDQELMEVVKSVCDQIDEKLFEEMCSKELINDDKFVRLIRLETDGKDYYVDKQSISN
ncbi:hypothetical protein BpHYR1_024880 [Brachionus plicatilis]|uniref:Uncharacterized protein n=1 Tax=Brachionus plicatilis TaxID=10195 RepID=A0A3M7PG65_BRAPC|nr:hypothetical protein BpHYR1_024880 [Brachionus plicatilis]